MWETLAGRKETISSVSGKKSAENDHVERFAQLIRAAAVDPVRVRSGFVESLYTDVRPLAAFMRATLG